MKTLKTNNEMNYKVLFESAMDRIAELEQELATLKNNEPIAEPTDSTQVIREQIIELLQEDGAEDVMEALIGVFEGYDPEYGYYVLNDETGLNYLLKRHFSNDLVAYSKWVTSEFDSHALFFKLTPDGKITCESSLDVFADLMFFVKLCPDEALDEMIVLLDELQLW